MRPTAPRGQRAIGFVVTVACAAALAAGCAQAPYRTGGAPETGGDSGIPAAEQSLWVRITGADYSTWKVAPGFQVPRPSTGPHGERVQIFLNDTAAEAREQAAPQWPDGSIIVTDILDDHSIVRVAAMEKRRGSWYFALWTPDGQTVVPEGQECTACHERGTDGTLGVRIGP